MQGPKRRCDCQATAKVNIMKDRTKLYADVLYRSQRDHNFRSETNTVH